jgi:hypothetical protein
MRCSDLQGVVALFEYLMMVSLDIFEQNTNGVTQLGYIFQARLDLV